MQAYISGPLTNSNRKELYEKIGEEVERLGYEAYIPHMHTDPEKNPDATPEEVYVTDMYRVDESDLIIAYVGEPSLGVGAELERASANQTHIILMYEKGKKVSRLVRGMPMVKAIIEFTSEEDALFKLRMELK